MTGLFDDQVPPAAVDDPVGGPGTPLAERMRPRALDEVVGHEAVVGDAGFLRRALADDRVPSMVLWGPPGAGKTTLARIVAHATHLRYVPFSAVTSGIKDVKQVMADAAALRQARGERTLLFVDEIHRFNRAQQDAFLPYVERGDIVLVGATTENPSFQVNGALLSRARVVVLEPLTIDNLVQLLRRALDNPDRGLGGMGLEAADDALAQIAQLASGDARRALNLLENAALDVAGDEVGSKTDDEASMITADTVSRVAQRKILLYDQAGEEHFNLISALHKSLRESDGDAALYWLARMLEAGEDPHYIARRMVRFASEDIGLADPRALRQALDAWEAFERLGAPEGELALAQATLYLALAPKSNAAYVAFKAAKRTVAERPADPVPKSIRNAPTRLMKEQGYGTGYVYAHDTAEGVGGMDCLPTALQGTVFFEPTGRGVEARYRDRVEAVRAARDRARERAGSQS